MLGSLGIGCDLTAMSPEELKKSAALVAQYKELRPLMQDFHRLENPSGNDYRLFQYSAPEGAVLFAFLPASRLGHEPTTVRLKGLDHAGTRYRFTHDWQQREASGEYLMHRGLRLWLQGGLREQHHPVRPGHSRPGIRRVPHPRAVLGVARVVLAQELLLDVRLAEPPQDQHREHG